MADYKDIVKLAVDGYKGNVEKYSVRQSQETLRQALIEANNGKTSLDYRDIRDGKCAGLFTILEEILSATVVEGLQEDDFFMAMTDFRNVPLGDSIDFNVEDKTLFVVSEAADGTQGIRRQRLSGVTTTNIPTSFKVVRIYEEMNRVLSGRIDFNALIQKVADSFKQKILQDVYSLWCNVTADDLGGTTYFPAGGSYDEDAILELIAHVEAAAGGKSATIVGTKKALRNLKDSMSEVALAEVHELGYMGKFYGTPVVAIPQRHKMGTTNFLMEDDKITIIAGDEKIIKVVYEGDPIVIMGDPLNNADFTNEYFFGEKYGVGMVMAGGNSGIGVYDLA